MTVVSKSSKRQCHQQAWIRFTLVGAVSEMDMLVDSGAGVSAIDKVFAEKYSGTIRIEPLVPSEIQSLVLGDGATRLEVVGAAYVQFFLGNALFTHRFFIVGGLGISVILGSDFFWKHKSSLDYGQKTFKPSSDLPAVSLVRFGSSGKPMRDLAMAVSILNALRADQPEGLDRDLSNAGSSVSRVSGNSESESVQKRARAELKLMFSPDVIFGEQNDASKGVLRLAHDAQVVPNKCITVFTLPSCAPSRPWSYAGTEPLPCFKLGFNVEADIGIARGVVMWRKGHLVPISILNLSSSPRYLKKGTPLGSIFELDHLAMTGELEIAPEPVDEPPLDFSKLPADKLETDSQRALRDDLLLRTSKVWARDPKKPDRTHLVELTLDTGDSPPINQRPYQYSREETEACRAEVQRLLDKGFIEPSTSPWASPVVMVWRNDKLRMCIDYRRLNQVLKHDAHGLGRIDDLFSMMAGAVWFSTLDMAAGYHQIPIHPESREKTAFRTSWGGLYQYVVAPFGLKSLPGLFMRLTTTVLGKALGEYAGVWIDDIVIFSKTFEEHVKHLEDVFQRLIRAHLSLNMEKAQLFQSEVKYLGFLISGKGIQVDPQKVEAVRKLAYPTTVREVFQVMGLFNFFRQYIKDFSRIAAPLSRYLVMEGNKKGKQKASMKAVVDLDEAGKDAMDRLVSALTSAPILVLPQKGVPYIIYTDASEVGIGATLGQPQADGRMHPIAYGSRKLSKLERTMSASERELLAIVCFLRIWRSYLYGEKVTVVTDHASLQYMFTCVDSSPKLTRWALRLQEFSLVIQHRPGKANVVADALSRLKRKENVALVETVDGFPVLVRRPEGMATPSPEPLFRNEAVSLFSSFVSASAHHLPSDVLVGSDPYSVYNWDLDELGCHPELFSTVDGYAIDKRFGEPVGMFSLLRQTQLLDADAAFKQPIAHGDGLFDDVPFCPVMAASSNSEFDSNTAGDVPLRGASRLELTMNNLKVAQSEDPFCFTRIALLKDGIQPSDPEQQLETAVEGSIYTLNERGVLIRQLPSDRRGRVLRQLVIPTALVSKVLALVHDDPLLGGHRSKDGTFEKAMQWFYWRGMYRDISEYCGACRQCARHKRASTRVVEVNPQASQVSRPWQKVEMDLLDLGLPSEDGYLYVLALQCCFTKFLKTFPLANKSATTVAECLFSTILAFGAMESLLSDQGREFCNAIVDDLMKLCDVHRLTSSGYRPQTTGQIERVNGVLIAMLSTINAGADWPKFLPVLDYCYNSTVHRAIGVTPFFAMNGRDIVSPFEVVFRLESRTGGESFELWVEERARTLQKLTKLLEERAEDVVSEMQRNDPAVGRSTVSTFKPGDWVLMAPRRAAGHTSASDAHKLQIRWHGPWCVLEDVHKRGTTFRCRLMGRRPKYVTVHKHYLKPYREPAQHGLSGRLNPSSEFPHELDVSQGLLSADKPIVSILDRKRCHNTWHYKIRRVDQSVSEWLPESSLRNWVDVIALDEFHALYDRVEESAQPVYARRTSARSHELTAELALAKFPIGTMLMKSFASEDGGSNQYYCGTVVGFKSPWFRVRYGDGDAEELTLTELQPLVELHRQFEKAQRLPQPVTFQSSEFVYDDSDDYLGTGFSGKRSRPPRHEPSRLVSQRKDLSPSRVSTRSQSRN
ncbi:unnamed protein product [Phaeothamnion confervicola]